MKAWNEPKAIRAILEACPQHVRGPEDVQIFETAQNQSLLLSTDHISARQAFPGEDVRSLVRRGLVEAASDIAAAGGALIGVQVDVAAPNDFSIEDFSAVGWGLSDGLVEMGGELLQASNLSGGEFSVSYTVVGLRPRGHRLSRKGIRERDLVCVSGPVGGWNCALSLLNHGHVTMSDTDWGDVRRAFLDYRAEMEYGRALAATQLVSACTDANDSFDKCLRDLVVGQPFDVFVTVDHVPLDSVAGLAVEAGLPNQVRSALMGISGDDRLLFTLPAYHVDEVRTQIQRLGRDVYPVGTVYSGSGRVGYDSLAPRSQEDDDRISDIYSSSFRAPLPLVLERFGRGGRLLNHRKDRNE